MSTHNIGFYGELKKIILQLSSNTLLICSSDHLLLNVTASLGRLRDRPIYKGGAGGVNAGFAFTSPW